MNKPIKRTRPGTTPVVRQPHVSVTTYTIDRAETDSRQIATMDEFEGLVVAGNNSVIVQPPYSVLRLLQIVDQSNMLRQCVDAYVTNIVSVGREVDPLYRGGTVDLGEQHELQSFIDNANVEQSLDDVLELVIRDRENVGFGFIEVIRDRTGFPSLYRHAPALYTRLSLKHPDPQLTTVQIMRGRRVTTVVEWRRFRRFVQVVSGRIRWFKEFGDPRKLDYQTGAFEGEPQYNEARQATEILHEGLPSSEPYGVPRWIAQLPSILGSREAEEVNMRYFQDNTVPPMMLLVGNGRLTAESHRQLNAQLNVDGVGKARQNRVLLLEAVGESDSLDGKANTVDLRVEKLTDARQSDSLFAGYDEANMAKVRSAFRLPPTLVGMSQDANYATANVSVFVAESQVFAPERSRLDGRINRLLINGPNGLQLRTCKLTSRTPSITSPEMVVKTMTALNVMGALTPRSAQAVANRMLQLEVGTYPEKGEPGYAPWMDKPIILETKGATTHDAQNQKTDGVNGIKAQEEGNVGLDRPKNGEQ
jgi:PBSX family phage portal protein